jgi:hypothetical protein
MIAGLESRVRKRKLKIRRAAGCAAEPAGVPRPNPRNSSYWTGTSRRGARIFERPGLRLLYPEKSQTATEGRDSSRASGDTHEQRSSSIAVS